MHSKGVDETVRIAASFVTGIVPRADRATIVGLEGNLGSGKTTFVKAVADALGVEDTVTSPTFVIMKIYDLQPTAHNAHFEHLVHIDAYRLESGEELRVLGWDDISADSRNLIFIEWSERVADALPKDVTKFVFNFIDEHTRDIEMAYE